MKIAIFVDQFPIRSQTFVVNQITGLIDLGVEVTIIALHEGNTELFKQGDYLKYHLKSRCIFLLAKQNYNAHKFLHRFIATSKGLMTPSSTRKVLSGFRIQYGKQALNLMLSTIAANQRQVLAFDWIICHFGPNGVLANKLRKMGIVSGRIGTIFHGFDMSVKSQVSKGNIDYADLFSETELMLPISELWKNKLVRLGAEKNKTKVHRMGVNLAHFSFQPTLVNESDKFTVEENEAAIHIFTVARFTEKKGLKYAIKAVALLAQKIPVNYQLAGYGELEDELRAYVKHQKIEEFVTFCGPYTPMQVKNHMQSADVFLQPSITADNGDMEGVPVTIMEAMAVGIPIITTTHSGIPELIDDNVQGLLVPEKNAQAIADKIEWIYSNKLQANNIKVQARNRIEEVGDVNMLNKQLLQILKSHS